MTTATVNLFLRVMVATATESGFYRLSVTFDEKVEESISWTKDKDASLVTQ